MQTQLEIPFSCARHAEIVYNSLRVDAEPKRSGMTKSLKVSENILTVNFECTEARTMRVSVNTFLDLLILVTQTIDSFAIKSDDK